MQKRANIQKTLKRKYPEQIVLVTTRKPAGGANVMAVGWVAVASEEPLMFVLGIDDGAYTYKLIKQTKEFVIAFPNEKMAGEVLFVGTRHGQHCDKIAASGLRVQQADKVKAPLIADAVANFECRLVDIYRPGDCPLIIGKVVAASENIKADLKRLYTVGAGYKMSGVRPLPKK
ncbi:MAG: flavin reductase family protein [Kiritimatiellae bacterium]|nr:flavin reductase family protein [Verrucomicrobiota bacterium]MCG2659167.1 flavin reductase family protein [Kiritimatiellia bacterium]